MLDRRGRANSPTGTPVDVVLTGLDIFGVWRWLGRQAEDEEGRGNRFQGKRVHPWRGAFPGVVARAADPFFATARKSAIASRPWLAVAAVNWVDYLVVSEGGLAGVGERLRRLAVERRSRRRRYC